MNIEYAEQLGFDQAWQGKAEPNDAAEWPADLRAAWDRGAALFHAWE